MQNKTKKACSLTVLLAVSLQLVFPVHAWAKTDSSSEHGPAGTLLLPLTPKIDTAPDDDRSKQDADNQDNGTTGGSKLPPPPPARNAAASSRTTDSPASRETPIKTITPQSTFEPISPTQPPDSVLETAPDKFKVEADIEDEAPMENGIGVDTTLQGTIQIVADDTEFDQDKNTFLGTGNAVAIIGGQNSKLEADMILYDQTNEIIDARGNVRIIRDGQVTTGSSFKFKVSSDEYLITNPDTEINGTTIIARKGQGTEEGMRFSKGEMTMAKPFYMQS